MQYAPGDRVRLIKTVPMGKLQGPPIGAVGSVIALEIPATRSQPSCWRVVFDDFAGHFIATSRPGVWFVESDEIELLLTGE